MSALETGLAFLPMTAAILGANLISGRVNAAIGPSRAILVGLAAMTAGCAGLLWVSPATGYPAMLAQQILLGGGLGTLVPPMTSVLLASAERSRSGVTSGALTAFRQAGQPARGRPVRLAGRRRFLRRLPYRPGDLRGYPHRQRGRGRRRGRDRAEGMTATRPVTVIGAATSAGTHHAGQERAPDAMRAAGLIERLVRAGITVTDHGNVVRETFRVDAGHRPARNWPPPSGRRRRSRTRSSSRRGTVRCCSCSAGTAPSPSASWRACSGSSPTPALPISTATRSEHARAGSGILDSMGIAHLLGLAETELTGGSCLLFAGRPPSGRVNATTTRPAIHSTATSRRSPER